jgi:hypothetical protein
VDMGHDPPAETADGGCCFSLSSFCLRQNESPVSESSLEQISFDVSYFSYKSKSEAKDE